jgi:hypothetical protein
MNQGFSSYLRKMKRLMIALSRHAFRLLEKPHNMCHFSAIVMHLCRFVGQAVTQETRQCLLFLL